jgi:hypothetical protein
MSEDQDEDFDFPSLQLTEADLALIDDISAGNNDVQSNRDNMGVATNLKSIIPPLSKYRRSGVLTVTDLVAPAWSVFRIEQSFLLILQILNICTPGVR